MSNVCEIKKRPPKDLGVCFGAVGELPIGDVMLAQKIALESCKSSALLVAGKFKPNRFSKFPAPPLRGRRTH